MFKRCQVLLPDVVGASVPRITSFLCANRLLATLPSQDVARLENKFERVDMPLRLTLSKPEKPIAHVYFPLSGMISLVQTLKDGSTVEVGLIGREGFFGVPLLHGVKSSPIEAMVQGTGEALRMETKAFLAEVDKNVPFQKILARYAQALFIQVTQTAVCNARHTVPQRMSRWLLEADDRIGGKAMPLSHEFLALMLGTRRPSVTLALGKFKDAGLVTSGRGRVGISNRAGVIAEACECYHTVHKEFARLLS